MYVDVKLGLKKGILSRTKVIDLDTGKIIERCISANDETGEYIVHMTNAKGEFVLNESRTKILREKKKGNIKIVIEPEQEKP